MENLENKSYGCIYKLTNLVNGKIYIGQSTKIEDVSNRIYKGSGVIIGKAIKKYGWDNFKSKIIDYADNQNELNEKEPRYIKEYNSLAPNGYNLMDGGRQGGKHHPTTKDKIRAATTGDKNPMYGVQLSGESNGMHGKTHTDEVKQKLSSIRKGTKLKREIVEKIRNKNIGKKRTEEFKIRNKLINKNRKVSEETKIKLSKSLKGRPAWNKGVSMKQEQKDNLRQKNLGRKMPDEFKKKMSDLTSGESHPRFGKINSEEMRKKISNSLKNKALISCPNCNLQSRNSANMKRYHLDNCKNKTNENKI